MRSRELGLDLPPGAICVVSVHWVTRGPRSDAHSRRARSYFSRLLPLIPSFVHSVYAVVCAVSDGKQHLSQRHSARWVHKLNFLENTHVAPHRASVRFRHRLYLAAARISPGHLWEETATAAALRVEIRRQRTLRSKAGKGFSPHGPAWFSSECIRARVQVRAFSEYRAQWRHLRGR